MVNLVYCNRPSRSAYRLRKGLGWKKWKRRFCTEDDIILNWGCSDLPIAVGLFPRVLNSPGEVGDVADKLRFFRNMSTVLVPPWTIKISEASEWIQSGGKVVCRTLTRSHGGRGIVLATTQDELVKAPLYTLYIPKKDEYRFHIFRGEVIDVQQKLRSKEHKAPNWMIRNHDNGFIYARQNLEWPPAVEEVSMAAMQHTLLDFGAVDVIWNAHRKRAYVLEINTAPGIEGSTLQAYVNRIKRGI